MSEYTHKAGHGGVTLKEVVETILAQAKESGEAAEDLTVNWEQSVVRDNGSTINCVIMLSDGSTMDVDVKLPTH